MLDGSGSTKIEPFSIDSAPVVPMSCVSPLTVPDNNSGQVPVVKPVVSKVNVANNDAPTGMCTVPDWTKKLMFTKDGGRLPSNGGL